MSNPEDVEPPRQIWYGLDDALALLATLEDARDALILTGRFGLVVVIEEAIQRLSRKLELGDEGDPDGK